MDVVEVHSNLAGLTGDSNGFVALGWRTNASQKSGLGSGSLTPETWPRKVHLPDSAFIGRWPLHRFLLPLVPSTDEPFRATLHAVFLINGAIKRKLMN